MALNSPTKSVIPHPPPPPASTRSTGPPPPDGRASCGPPRHMRPVWSPRVTSIWVAVTRLRPEATGHCLQSGGRRHPGDRFDRHAVPDEENRGIAPHTELVAERR